MSTSDPRRNAEDGRAGEPATAVAADASTRTTGNDSTNGSVGTDRDAEHARHGQSTDQSGPDGAIRDSERRDATDGNDDHDGSTRVLPATEQPRHVEDHRTRDDRPTVASPTVAAPPAPAERTAETENRLDLRSVHAREKEEFGGMRFWLAFFGWLTATGLAVLLGAIAAGILAAVGNSNGATSSTGGLQSLGLAGAIVTAVILFVAYYAGGYVAGRMARFSGAKQGVAVWLWAIIISVLAALAGAIGSSFGLFSQVGNVAQVQLNPQTLTAAGIIGIVIALALSLLGAVLGGLAGMRYHRKVDRAAFGA
jgi:hypothetical protein